MKHHLAIGIMAMTALGACGSSETFDERVVALDDAFDAFTEDTYPVRDFSDLPDSGRGTYDGQLGVVLDDGDDTRVIGDLNLSVDFGATVNPVTGSAGNFVSETDESFSGRLDVGNTAFGDSGIATGVGFTGDLDGTLNGPQTGTVVVDSSIAGTFGTDIRGSDSVVGVLGGVAGTALIDGDVIDVEGGYVVQ